MTKSFIACHSNLFANIATIVLVLSASTITEAGIIPDNTLPVNSVIPPDCINCTVTGGISPNTEQLFHSFEEFSIPAESSVLFDNSAVTNSIFVRVTGNKISRIDGQISANGTADLYLFNPKGIIFGEDSSLNLGGSFLSTSAESILFESGAHFSATNHQALPSPLMLSMPVGLQFGKEPGLIENRSLFAPDPNTLGLTVKPGKTLGFIGGPVNFSGGLATAPRARVQVGSVGTDEMVRLLHTTGHWQANFDSVSSFQDIKMTEFSLIDTSNFITNSSDLPSITSMNSRAGIIQLRGRNISILEGSQIASSTLSIGTSNQSEVKISASGKLIISGQGLFGPSGVFNPNEDIASVALNSSSDTTFLHGVETSSITALGPTVFIQAKDILLEDGAIIDTSTFGQGKAGSAIIKTNRLLIDGAQIVLGTLGQGDAGDLELEAESITITGTIPAFLGAASGIFASIDTNMGRGSPGSITIKTQDLTLLEGAQIFARGGKAGTGGSASINASNFIRIDGAAPYGTDSMDRSGIFITVGPTEVDGIMIVQERDVGKLNIVTPELTVENGGEISAENFGTTRGGNIRLNVGSLLVKNGRISAASFEKTIGQAGSLTIHATETIQLDNGVLEVSTSGQGGANIEINDFNVLNLQNESLISASALNKANGGNITILSSEGFILAVPNQDNDIIANAAEGKGGVIDITVASAFGIRPIDKLGLDPLSLKNGRSEFNASSRVADNSGDVNLNNLNPNPASSLAELPSDLVDASSLINNTLCSIGNKSEFLVTGRGGLPTAPTDTLSATAPWEDWELSEFQSSTQPERAQFSGYSASPMQLAPSTPSLIEAKQWSHNAQGQVVLHAAAPTQHQIAISNCRDLRQQLHSLSSTR